MSKPLRATCYLKLEPVLNSRDEVRGFKVTGVTQNRPHAADSPGSRLVKLTIKVPGTAFDPLQATMDVPAVYLEAPVAVEPDAREAHHE